MRFHCLLLLVLLAGCLPDPPGAGTEGHPCRTGFNANWACNEGLRCMDEGCVACGEADEVCCVVSLTEVCDDGVVCDGGNGGYDENPGSCTVDCGMIGLPCCDGDPCPGGGECVVGTCEAPLTNPCFDGSDPHIVAVVSADCQYTSITLMTNTVEEAEECRYQLVLAAEWGQEICPLDQAPETTELCKYHPATGYSPIYFDACSAAQLAICEQYNCVDDCTWTEGACPE